MNVSSLNSTLPENICHLLKCNILECNNAKMETLFLLVVLKYTLWESISFPNQNANNFPISTIPSRFVRKFILITFKVTIFYNLTQLQINPLLNRKYQRTCLDMSNLIINKRQKFMAKTLVKHLRCLLLDRIKKRKYGMRYRIEKN